MDRAVSFRGVGGLGLPVFVFLGGEVGVWWVVVVVVLKRSFMTDRGRDRGGGRRLPQNILDPEMTTNEGRSIGMTQVNPPPLSSSSGRPR